MEQVLVVQLSVVFVEENKLGVPARYGIIDSSNDYASNSYTTFLGIYDSAALGDSSGIAAGLLTHRATVPDHGKTLGVDVGPDEAAHELRTPSTSSTLAPPSPWPPRHPAAMRPRPSPTRA